MHIRTLTDTLYTYHWPKEFHCLGKHLTIYWWAKYSAVGAEKWPHTPLLSFSASCQYTYWEAHAIQMALNKCMIIILLNLPAGTQDFTNKIQDTCDCTTHQMTPLLPRMRLLEVPSELWLTSCCSKQTSLYRGIFTKYCVCSEEEEHNNWACHSTHILNYKACP